MARIRPASHWQHPRSPVRRLAEAGRRVVKKQIAEALRHLASEFDRKKAADLIKHGRPHSVVNETIDWKHFREIVKSPLNKIADVYEAGARLGVRKINGAFHGGRRRVHFGKAVGDRFNFDRLDPKVLDNLRAEQDALIKEIEVGARDTIEQTITIGLQEGLSPEEISESIRSVIGLTDQQARAVLNYRDMINDLDSGALRRMLRDEQYDAAFRDAIANDVELDVQIVNDMVDAYAENYLTYRAETIGRTESTRAANSGLEDAYSQAIDRGALPAEAVKKFWQIALDEKTCPICLSIPDLNPDGVPIGEDFDSEDGPQSTPPDPHPSCRCSIDVITDLNLIPDEDNAP